MWFTEMSCDGFFPFYLLVGRNESEWRDFVIVVFKCGLFEQPACQVF